MANFHPGQAFSSFWEFQKCLRSYENENFVKFTKRHSRKLLTAARTCRIAFDIKPDLVYSEITYMCFRGGAKNRSRSTGMRKTSSCKIECPAHISLRATKEKCLEVKSFCDTHNHEISKELIPKKFRKHLQQETSNGLIETASNNVYEDLEDDLQSIHMLLPVESNERKSNSASSIINKPKKGTGAITKAIKDNSNKLQSVHTRCLCAHTTIIEDECDIMGKQIAVQLRMLPELARLKANLEIQKLLMNFRIDHMNSQPMRTLAKSSSEHHNQPNSILNLNLITNALASSDCNL